MGLSPVALLAMILAAVAAALTVLLVVAHRVLRRRRALLGKADGAANSMHESMTIATAFTKLGEGSPEKSQPQVNVDHPFANQSSFSAFQLIFLCLAARVLTQPIALRAFTVRSCRCVTKLRLG